jgi:subtilisin family serine protease
MRNPFPILIALSLGIHVAAVAQQSERAQAIPGRVIVKLRGDSPSAAASATALLDGLRAAYGFTSIDPWLDTALLVPSAPFYRKGSAGIGVAERSLLRIVVVRYSAAVAPGIVARAISALDGVEYAEPLFRRSLSSLPNDPLNTKQSYLEQVHAPEGWGLEQGDSSIVIAIVDTGIDPLHPDLRDAVWTNPGESGRDNVGNDRRSNGIDDDRNGFVDDWRGYDFFGSDGRTPDNDPSPGHWHGTHVAGIAAASGDNGVGVTGVGFGARLLSLKISGDAPDVDPILSGGFDAILYASKMGARIINCSWGGPGRSRAEQEVVDLAVARGSLIVAAAGNEGDRTELYPASYRGVLSVASVTSGDRRSNFSNYNSFIGIAAPGEGIYSTMPVGSGSYGVASGTSMATPIVAGAAALVVSRFPGLAPDAVAAVLRAGADDIDSSNPGYRALLGTGRLNIERSLLLGPDALHIDIISATARDENGDGLIDPLEKVEIVVELKNVLHRTSDLRLSIVQQTEPIPVEIVSGTDRLGVVESGELRSTHSGALVFRAPKDLPTDYQLPLLVAFSDGDIPVGSIVLDLTVNPNFSTTTNDIITATFTGNGRIGFNDFPRNSQGEGFRIDTSDNLLAEAGLIIAVGRDRLVDVVRSTESGSQSTGLTTRTAYRWTRPDSSGAAIGNARFDDRHVGAGEQIGIDVRLTTYAYPGPVAGNQILVLYTIRNTSERRFDSLFASLYLDWDIGSGGIGNQVELDGAHRLGIVSNVDRPDLPTVGTMLLGDQPMNFVALDNAREPLRGGFFPGEKWDAVSHGIGREKSDVGDCSMIIGAGPIALDAGKDTLIAFSLIAASDTAALTLAAEEGREIFRRLGFVPGGPLSLPKELALAVGPNPFTGRLAIEFSLPDESPVRLELFNSLGERIAILADGDFPRGSYSVGYVADQKSDGIYIVRMSTAEGTIVRKTVRLAGR